MGVRCSHSKPRCRLRTVATAACLLASASFGAWTWAGAPLSIAPATPTPPDSAARAVIGLNPTADGLAESPRCEGHSIGDFVEHLYHDFTTQATFPVRYARDRPGRFILGFGCISALILTDHLSYDALRPDPPGEDLVDAALTLTDWGRTRPGNVLILGLGVLGWVADRPYEKDTAFMLAEVLMTSGGWAAFLKATTGRERPLEREERISDWEGPDYLPGTERHGLRSFPSGHASRAWAIATVLAHRYPRHGVVPVLGYATATAVSYSRMVLRAHWLSDVVVGGLIGYGCAMQVLSAHRADAPRPPESRLQLGVDLTGDYRGISVRYRF
jgi:undecaprenyl-diphosphatase